MPTSRRPSGRPQTRRTSPQARKQETSRVKRSTRAQPARPKAPKKPPMGLIIGGSVAGASILLLILILIMSGGEKQKPVQKKKDDVPFSGNTGNTGEVVDEARVQRGLVKCEKGYDLYRKLKGRMHNRSGMSDSELQVLCRDLEKADSQIKKGLADIELANGKANVKQYQNAHKDMKMVLMELK